MNNVGYTDPPSVWNDISENDLKSFDLREKQMMEWNRMIQNIEEQKKALQNWDLSEIADNVILSGYHDISEWKNMPENHLSGKLKMTPKQIQKWNDGVKK